MATPETQGTAPVVDRRPIPRGVLPKGIQTWLMVALAIGIVLIIFLTGQPQAPERAQAAAPVQQVVSPDRVRDYQERLRALSEPAAAETVVRLLTIVVRVVLIDPCRFFHRNGRSQRRAG